jgi:2-methylcitrate dehydratase PrpD
MGPTEKIARFVREVTYRALPARAVEVAKEALLDCVGVALAGSRERSARIAAALARAEAARPEATVFGQGFRTSASLAALVNGTAAHALDYDHSLDLMGQPTAGLIPALFALGESCGAGGGAVVEAYAAGFEVTAKLARAVPALSSRGGWHATATVGSLGSAAACSKLLGLDEPQVRTALGIAASMASGVVANFGTMTKPLHAGLAARNGVTAAKLARAGFSANGAALDADAGFLGTFARGLPTHLEAIEELGRSYDLVERGIRVKAYPCGGLTHSAIDALLALRREHGLVAEEIEAIDVDVTDYTYRRITCRLPATGLEGKFSMAYVLSRALLDGEVALAAFSDAAVAEARVREVAAKVTMRLDPELEEDGAGGRPCRVTVRLKGGRRLAREVRHPRGSRESPLGRKELEEKFFSCARLALDDGAARRALTHIERLEELETIEPLARLLAG